MDLSKLMRLLLVIINFFCLILAIIVMCLSIGHWHEYTGGAVTLIVSIAGLVVACVSSQMILIGWSVLTIIDVLIILANAIYLTIKKSFYSDYCFDNDSSRDGPEWGCYDWRNGYYERATGVMICLFILFVFRVLNIACSCLLARDIYEEQYDEDGGVGDIRRDHDLGEKGTHY